MSLTKLGELLQMFFSGNCRAPLERTQLHDAAERGEVERVQRLLSTGSLNVNSRTVIVSISIMVLVDCMFLSVSKVGGGINSYQSLFEFTLALFISHPIEKMQLLACFPLAKNDITIQPHYYVQA